MTPETSPAQPPVKPTKAEARAAALRANLLRRKAFQRALADRSLTEKATPLPPADTSSNTPLQPTEPIKKDS